MENNTTEPTLSANEFLQPTKNISEQVQQRAISNNWKTATLILGILLVVSLGSMIYLCQQKNNNQLSTNGSERVMQPETASNIKENDDSLTTENNAKMETYTSLTEKVTFQYPSDWIVIKPQVESNMEEADEISLQSPSGDIVVTWVSYIEGLGGGCDKEAQLGTNGSDFRSCSLINIIEKIPIAGAPNLVVAMGTITNDGKIYKPWVAVQNEDVQTRRDMEYGTFTAKNNGGFSAILTTANINLSGPELSEIEAKQYLNKPELKQAKEIMQSLKY
ncbi:MAG: hypothetical protein H6772_01835 [Pseudomonadales bacterium]|nr:hypothetical protein [Pseudomonadales bacterium]